MRAYSIIDSFLPLHVLPRIPLTERPSLPTNPENTIRNQNGTELMKHHDAGLVAVNAVASLASTDTQLATAFVNELWSLRPPWGKYRYYPGVLIVLSGLQVSGHFRAWYP